MTSAAQDGHGALAADVALTPDTAERLGALYARIVESVQSVLYADDDTVQLAVGCLLAQGHLLVEDLPGLGKTTLAKALARSLGLDFHRVQFTADLLPADVTGAMVLDRRSRGAHVPPRTDLHQRADGRRAESGVSSLPVRSPRGDGGTPGHRRRHDHALAAAVHGARHPEPLRCGRYVATPRTDNATASSFACRWATPAVCTRTGCWRAPVRHRSSTRSVPRSLDPTSTHCCAGVSDVHVSEAIRGYILDIVTASRAHPALAVGASPRGAIALRLASARHGVGRAAGTTSSPPTYSGRPSRRSAIASSSCRAASAPEPASKRSSPTSSIRSLSQGPRRWPTPEPGAERVARETITRGRPALA